MSNHSIIEHRANYHFARLEEDYLAICSHGKCSPHCKALILAILEHWTNTKRDKGEGPYVYLTMPQWIKYTYMLYERNIITDCIRELLEEGLIDRRQIIMFDQKTFEYRLQEDKLNVLIKELPAKDPKELLPRLDAYLDYKARAKAIRDEKKAAKEQEEAREKSPTQENEGTENTKVGEKSRTVSEKSQGVGEKSTEGYVKNQRNIDSITKILSTSTKDTYVSSDTSHTHAPSSEIDSNDERHSSTDVVNNNEHDVDNVTQDSGASSEQKEAPNPGGDAPPEDVSKQPSYSQQEATPDKTEEKDVAPVTTRKTANKGKKGKKNEVSLMDTTPIPLPEKPSPDALWTPLTCMQLADYYRGSILPESNRKDSKYMRAVGGCFRLVNQQRKTYEEVDKVFRFMKCVEKEQPDGIWDEWWDGKDVDVWHVADHCTAKLREIEEKRKAKARLAAKESQTAPSDSTPSARPSVLVSEDARQRNIERLREKSKSNGSSSQLVPVVAARAI